MEIRDATPADGPGIARVRGAIGGQHDDSGSDPAYRAHLMAHGRLLVAVAEGEVVGFAGTRDVDGHRLLGDLFVLPSCHGTGIGGRLLEAVLAGAERRFTFASSDPSALPMYARAGMRARWPLLYLAGPAAATGPATDGLRVRPCEPGEASEVEASITGRDRIVEHRYWAARDGANAVVVESPHGITLAAGAVMRRGALVRVEHLAVAGEDHARPALASIVAWSGAEDVVVYVPGPHPLAEHLLRSRLRVVDSDTYMSVEADAVPSQLAVVHPGLA